MDAGNENEKSLLEKYNYFYCGDNCCGNAYAARGGKGKPGDGGGCRIMAFIVRWVKKEGLILLMLLWTNRALYHRQKIGRCIRYQEIQTQWLPL
jgi:hypothetical protein